MDAARAILQREFAASSRTINNKSSQRSIDIRDSHFLGWLQDKRKDALNDWRRLHRRIIDEHLDSDRVEREINFYKKKYERYFSKIGVYLADAVVAPWQAKDHMSNPSGDADRGFKVCSQTRCRQHMPLSGSSMDNYPPQCGVCAADIDAALYNQCVAEKDTLLHCAACGNDICFACGQAYCERTCKNCDRTVGIPPSIAMAQKTRFSCWSCGTDQEETRRLKVAISRAKNKKRDTFRCGECTTKICVGCAKPVTYSFDPDYGFFWNGWYKFYDNFLNPPERHGGFEKYYRRERRLGIPKFNVEGLYTPGFQIDPEDKDTTLYDYVAPKKKEGKQELDRAQSTRTQNQTPKNDDETAKMDIEVIPSMARPTKRNNPQEQGAYRVRRVNFGYASPPPQGYDDSWYAQNNSVLYGLACKWAETYFAKRTVPDGYSDRTWFSGLGDQFIQYAHLVAHEDPFFGPKFNNRVDGWEHVIRDRRNRKWLIVGVLAQIIEKKIYVELLFGATEKQEKHLNEQDNRYLDNDGYQRAAARSQEINMVLGRKAVPDRFWDKVDSLTAYTAKVFEELFAAVNIVDNSNKNAGHEKIKAKRAADIAFMYAELHYLIAHAAYFHVCMRRSSSIFHFLSATPAARMDYPIEGQACYDLYKLSKEEAERREKVKSGKAKQELQELLARPNHEPEAVERLKRTHRVAAHHRLRGAKVKFAVWPMITRYRAENVGEPIVRPGRGRFDDVDDYGIRDVPTQDEVENGEGQRIATIGKCVVVYYQGVIYPEDKEVISRTFESDGRPLLYYLDMEKSAEIMEKWKKIGARMFLGRMFITFFLGFVYVFRAWAFEFLSNSLALTLLLIAYILYGIFFRTYISGTAEVGMLVMVVTLASLLAPKGLSTFLLELVWKLLRTMSSKAIPLTAMPLAAIVSAVKPRWRNASNNFFGLTASILPILYDQVKLRYGSLIGI